jgi:hypothetical protein
MTKPASRRTRPSSSRLSRRSSSRVPVAGRSLRRAGQTWPTRRRSTPSWRGRSTSSRGSAPRSSTRGRRARAGVCRGVMSPRLRTCFTVRQRRAPVACSSWRDDTCAVTELSGRAASVGDRQHCRRAWHERLASPVLGCRAASHRGLAGMGRTARSDARTQPERPGTRGIGPARGRIPSQAGQLTHQRNMSSLWGTSPAGRLRPMDPPRGRRPWWFRTGWVLVVVLGVAGLVALGLLLTGVVRSEPLALLAVLLPLAAALLIIGLQSSGPGQGRG